MDDIIESQSSSGEKIHSSHDVLHKAEIMAFNNSWNDKNEQIIISIGENSASYKWMHEKCANYHKFIHRFTSILLIILSTALSAETIIPTNNYNDNDNNNCNSDFTLDIIKRIFVYIVTVLSVLQNFLKSQETGEKHLIASNAFSNLYHDIQQQMCMFRRDRINATRYVSDCLKQYDSLIINNPDISSHVLKKLKNTFNNTGISLPDIADKIQKIEIITEDSPTSEHHQHIQQYNQDVKKHKESIINANNINNKQSNICNLAEIHNAFQIHGDISDKDLENINSIEFKSLREKFLDTKSNYEYQRFLQHSHEND